MAKGQSTKAVLTLMLIGIGGVGALAWYAKTEGQIPFAKTAAPRREQGPQVEVERPKPTAAPNDTPTRTEDKQTVEVPVIKDGKLTGDAEQADVPDGKDPKAFLAERIGKSVGLDNVRVLGVDVRNGTAVINFAKGIDDGMGDEQEGLFLNSLQQAFAQFDGVKNLELDKEGEKLESVGGHIDLTDGLPVKPAASVPPPSEPKPSEP